MRAVNRREFVSGLALALGAPARKLWGGADSLNETLGASMMRRKIPAVSESEIPHRASPSRPSRFL